LELVRQEEDLQANLSAAAHMIHGSSDERFTITYCPGNLTRTETESVNFKYGDLKEVMQKYNPGQLQYGFNQTAGNENIYFIPNPAAGLWSSRERFKN
ncbi:MAG TPA: D-mannonate epimerase, partial [Spirochaetota bacterium]|nr:D-mannonate epimerase [Spirochaetota bacterium]